MSTQLSRGPARAPASAARNGAQTAGVAGRQDKPSPFSLEALFPSLFKTTVKPREVIVFSRQLATLIKAGIPLLACLELLHGQAGIGKGFRRVLRAIIEEIGGGSSFSEALAQHPTVFADIYHRTVAVGERTGALETILIQLAEFQEKQGATFRKIKAAMTYPIIMMIVGVAVVGILTTVALPAMSGLFKTLGADLPLPTRILLGFSGFMTKYLLYIGGVVLFVVLVLVWGVSQPSGRRLMDKVKLSAPLIGPPLLMAEMARFCRTVSMLVGAGLPLQEIMRLIPQTTGNSVMRDAFYQVEEGLLLGQGISGNMARMELFPPLLVQMVTVGEESNSLDTTLAVVADFYEVNAEERLTAMVGLITPAMTIGLSLMTGFVALSVIMPMYSIVGKF